MKVNEKSKALEAHEADWNMIDALLGGTRTMRLSAEKYLPKFPAEEDDDYQRRKNQATLYPALKRTVGVMTGKPFSEPVTLNADLPTELQDLADDIDLEGNNLHSWAASAFYHTMAFGYGGILVDFPVVNQGAGARTQAEEAAIGARPYFVHIKAQQILGFKIGKGTDGKPRIMQLRILECVQEDDGQFGTEDVEQVKVLEPGKWETWREKEKQTQNGVVKEWALHDEGVTTIPVVPFVFLYGMRKAFGDAEPPLLDLAFLNVKHWQSQSDQDNILHVARVPILAIIGGGEDDQIKIGQQAVKVPLNGDIKFVEHTGKAIEAGHDALEKLELQMIQTGAELLVMKPGQRTATESNNEAEGNKSDLQRLCESFEDSLDQAFGLAALWKRMQLTTTTGLVKLFTDFGAWTLDQASGQLIQALQQGGLITKETAIEELQRRGILSADIDPASELDKVEEEGPPLGTAGNPDPQPPGKGGGGSNPEAV